MQHDAGQQNQRLFADGLDRMAVTVAGGHGIAGGQLMDGAVVADAGLACEQVEDLGFVFMHMVGDGGAGIKGDGIEELDVFGHFGQQRLEMGAAFAAAQMLNGIGFHFGFEGDHGGIPP